MDSEGRRRILLLGPVAVVEDTREVDLGGRAQRSLLAALAVHRDRVVSADRLIDELWPVGPPAGAGKTLQVYISRLRGPLGSDVITHRSGGYLLRLPPGSVDVDEFEQRYHAGCELRARGESAAAAAELRAALALWRGPALGGITEGLLSAEIDRLESLRLAALEERIEADLDLGRHASLVPELEHLVREHPFRETLRKQLMLALYRSGRQTDALTVYREGRDALRDELGLEPQPELVQLERAILNHDPDLGGPSPRAAQLPARRRRARLAVVCGLVLTGAAFATVPLTSDGTHDPALAVTPDSLVQIDPTSNSLVAGLPIGSAPVAITTGAGSVWVANAGDQTLTRVDPADRQILQRTGLGRIPSQIAYADGAIWIASAIGVKGVVEKVDPGTASIVSTTTVRVGAGYGDDLFAPPTPSALAAGAGRIWVNNLRSNLSHFVPPHSAVLQELPATHSVDGIAVGDGAVWIASGSDDRVLRLDARSGVQTAEISIASAPDARVASPYGITVGYGAVWVTDPLSNTVSVIDPKLNAVTATIGVGDRPTRIAVGERGVWVVNAGDNSITRIDPGRRVVVATIPVGRAVTGIAAGLRGVWVTVGGGMPSESATPAATSVRPLATSSCGAPVGASAATMLIASELPTFRGEPSRDPVVADMRAAILAVLRQHRFRAGPYRIAYQACNDSNSGSGPSPARCAANARAYALDPSLIGVVGTFDSGCAEIELPTLNAAPAGPVAMISPTNTYVGLTHAGPATAADEPDRYRPTGARNYVRLLGTDDVQSAAIAMYLAHEKRERIYLLDDGGGTGFAGATYVAHAAARLGIAVAGTATWDPAAPGYRRLASKIKAARADAVVLSGCVCANGLRLVTDLRAVLGSSPILIGTDNFSESGDEFRTKFGRLGLRVSMAGDAPQTLPVAGRNVLARLAGSQALDDIDPVAAYAAEATGVLLDAIARSDGTRTSVTRALFATRLAHGLTGPIAFRPDGDARSSPITIYRVDAAVPHRSHRLSQGLVPEQTYLPPAGLSG